MMTDAVMVALIGGAFSVAGQAVAVFLHRRHEAVTRATFLLLNGETVEKVRVAYEQGRTDEREEGRGDG